MKTGASTQRRSPFYASTNRSLGNCLARAFGFGRRSISLRLCEMAAALD